MQGEINPTEKVAPTETTKADVFNNNITVRGTGFGEPEPRHVYTFRLFTDMSRLAGKEHECLLS